VCGILEPCTPSIINPEAIRYIESRIRKENLRNVKPILGRPDNPLLPGTVDAVLLLKTYHEVAQPIVLLRNLRASLSPGAKVGVIDRNGNGETHGVARDIVIREANGLAISCWSKMISSRTEWIIL
jgi:hypothetical protein